MLKPIDKRIKLLDMCPIYGLEVEDDSFQDLPQGSVLWVEEDTWDRHARSNIQEGDRVVFCRKDGRYFFGKVHFQGDQVRLEPLGKGEAPLLLTKKEKRRVHRVMGVDYPRGGTGLLAWMLLGQRDSPMTVIRIDVHRVAPINQPWMRWGPGALSPRPCRSPSAAENDPALCPGHWKVIKDHPGAKADFGFDGEAELFFPPELLEVVAEMAGGKRRRQISEAHKEALALGRKRVGLVRDQRGRIVHSQVLNSTQNEPVPTQARGYHGLPGGGG